MTILAHDLVEEPAGASYSELLAAALPSCDRALLVVRDSRALTTSGVQALAALQPFLIASDRRSVWPGTRLFSGLVDVHSLEFHSQSASVLSALVHRLYDWVDPDLPADLSLLRPDRRPWMVTVAHEQFGYLCLDADEVRRVRTAVPSIVLSEGRAFVDERTH